MRVISSGVFTSLLATEIIESAAGSEKLGRERTTGILIGVEVGERVCS